MIKSTSTLNLALTGSVLGSPVQKIASNSELYNQNQIMTPVVNNYEPQYQNVPNNIPVCNNNQFQTIPPVSYISQNNGAQEPSPSNPFEAGYKAALDDIKNIKAKEVNSSQPVSDYEVGYQETKSILQGLVNEDNTNVPTTACEAGSKQAIVEAKAKALDIADKTGVKPKGKFWFLVAAAAGIAFLFSK